MRDGLRVAALVLVGAGTAAGLTLAELGLRITGFGPEVGLFTVTERQYGSVPGTFAPDQHRIEARGTAFEHEVTINNLGYRGTERLTDKAPGEVRILFAGDSFTWGHNVSDGETLPAQLESVLRAACGTVTVANAGVSGTSILGHQAIIERGLVFEPDLVLLMYHENDIDELIHERMWERLAANRQTKSRFPLSMVYPVVRSSALWQLAQNVRRRVQMAEASPPPEAPAATGHDVGVDRARAEYASRLEAVRDLLSARGIRFGFVLFPHPESVSRGSGGRDYQWVLDTARTMEIRVLNLLPLLERAPEPVDALYLVPEDYHPSPAGYALTSRWLAREVMSLDTGLQTRCSPIR